MQGCASFGYFLVFGRQLANESRQLRFLLR